MSLVIVCGYGSTGRSAVAKLEREVGSIVVVDRQEMAVKQLAHPYIVGDATDEEYLKKAGIENADVLIATAGDDVTNAFIVLSARALNPSITILTTADRIENLDKLYKAGADYVVPESSIGAKELVNGALSYEKGMSRVYLGSGMEVHMIKSKKAGSVGEVERESGAKIIGIRNKKVFIGNPEKTADFHAGSSLYVVGNEKELSLARRIVQ